MDLLVLGGGKMGMAIVSGLIASGRVPQDIAVVEPIAARRDEIITAYPGLWVGAEPVAADGALIAVKPGDVAAAARAAADVGAARLLSVAAGVSTAAIEAAAGRPVAVVRAMPNTPALVGAGAAAICGGSTAGEDDLAWAEELLGAVGTVVRVPEKALDAVTGLSGSGPAYVFLVAEALAEAGVLEGLPRDVAEALAFQTLLGSARLLVESRRPAGRPARQRHLPRRHHRGRPARARAPRRPRRVPRGRQRRRGPLARARRLAAPHPTRQKGFEPLTFGSVDRRSIQLSYWRNATRKSRGSA